jgi:hypothetical protein
MHAQAMSSPSHLPWPLQIASFVPAQYSREQGAESLYFPFSDGVRHPASHSQARLLSLQTPWPPQRGPPLLPQYAVSQAAPEKPCAHTQRSSVSLHTPWPLHLCSGQNFFTSQYVPL